ncbi:MAG: restriction endonuclease subunit R, partial [Chloroflexi bacterium]|nr:restriction endonuclease subunit R [Chloroflexota bacterium]
MTESEKITRKKRIDKRLKSSLLNWKIILYKDVLDTSTLDAHAVTEYPTETGPSDYALFVKGRMLGIIEAKKVAVGAENVLEQAKRYSQSAPNTIGEWRGYKTPFLYSTNGEIIFHLDVRKKGEIARQLSDFHSPQALLDKFNRDTENAESWFQTNSVDTITRLRHYQTKAIEAIEQALIDGKKMMLLAMATGT